NDCYTWAEVPNIVGISGARTTAAFVYHWPYAAVNQIDELITPIIDLTGVATATLNFDLAHRRYDNTTNERLRILVSTDCGATWPTVIYNKCDNCAAPNNLNTTTNGTADFFPTASGQWRTETVGLNAFVGQRIRLKFETTNSYGNNTFIDNVRIPATGPKISFVGTAAKTTESSAGGTSGCRGYVDLTIPLQISAAPVGAATVTFSSAGSAHNGADYQILTPTVVFPNASTANQNLILRVFDDAAVESDETVVVSFTVSGTTNATASSTNIVHTLTIADNDPDPSPAAVVLLSENFESRPNLFPEGWSYFNVVSTNNEWTVGPNGGSGITGQSAYITNNLASRPLAYTNTQNTDVYLYSPLIDARKYANLTLSFRYKCNGEAGQDRGFVYYSFDLVNFVQILGPYNGTTTTTTVNFPLPAVLNNREFYLAWRFVTNNSGGANPPFVIDEISVTAPAVPIENALSSVQRYLGPRSTVYFINSSGRLMLKIVNDTDHDYGCTTVQIDRTGTSAVAFQNPAPSGYITSKTYLVTPTNNKPDGQYTATVYYLPAEVSGWETVTGNVWNDATIVKSGGAIANVTPSNPNANGPTNYYGSSPSTGTYGTGRTVTAAFNTGFSGMGVGKPGPGGPILDPPLFWDDFRLVGRIENDEAVLTWPETCLDCKYVLEKCSTGRFDAPQALFTQNGRYREKIVETTYYRVKRRNWDQTDYSNVVELSRRSAVLHPNPAQDFVAITGVEYAAIYDVLGREMYRAEGQTHQVRVVDWPAGVYTAVCVSGSRVERKKFVKI
ncbi:MAG: choice-of-anchor J domain-containing protein, partial [Bacteroidia bacterium]|nr:T9SS type A sorting domain-containing protein [Bacteroidia bacterium]MDW8333736.1 choice-of-anchor J domain-containing protein [Bacteroidia bacterium]